MANHDDALNILQPGDSVFIFPGLRKHNSEIRIDATEVCQVVEVPTDNQPADTVPAIAIRRPSGDVVLIDADMVGRVESRLVRKRANDLRAKRCQVN